MTIFGNVGFCIRTGAADVFVGLTISIAVAAGAHKIAVALVIDQKAFLYALTKIAVGVRYPTLFCGNKTNHVVNGGLGLL